MDGIEEIDNPRERGIWVAIEEKKLEIICEKGRDEVVFAISDRLSEDLESTTSRKIPRDKAIAAIVFLLKILKET